jgi:hypothetical protein
MIDAIDVARRYLVIWNETEPGDRYRRIAEMWNPDGDFVDPVATGQGYEQIDQIVNRVQQQFAGHAFQLIGEPEAVGSNVRLSWALAVDGGHPAMKGTDILRLTEDSRVRSVIGFFDPKPVPQEKPAWSIANWTRFWANPDPDVARARIATVALPNVTAHWPYQNKTVRGIDEYRDYIIELLTLVPDLALTLEEHATDGNNSFLRWSAHGTGPDGPIRCSGVDRVRTEGGKVIENRIFSDHCIFRTLAERMAPRLSDGQ